MRGNGEADFVLMRGLETLNDFIGIRNHFNDEKFIFDPSRRYVSSISSLTKRSDSRSFVDIGKKLPRGEVTERLITLFKSNRSGWIGNIVEPDFEKRHRERMAVITSLTFLFKRDVNKIANWLEENRLSLVDAFTSTTSAPMICSKVPGGVSDETICLLNKAFGFLSKPSHDVIWESRRFTLSKYSHCIQTEKKVLLEQCDVLVSATSGIRVLTSK